MKAAILATRPHGARAIPPDSRGPPSGAAAGVCATTRSRMWRLPDRPAHCRRRFAAGSAAAHPRSPDRGRGGRRRNCGAAVREPGGRVLDRRHRWGLLVLQHGMENLCDHPTFTGYTVNGGYAEYALARADFAFPLPEGLDNVHVAPLLCAGIIGFRSLRVAGVAPGERVGLYGFGSSASLAITVLQSWKCEVYVATRGETHRQTAASLGATWVGKEDETPPVRLDRAITFAPSGKVVVSALSALRKGGVVAINAIHLDQMPSFDYDKLLWGERQIRSVANMTRQDARDFLAIAQELKIRPQVAVFPLQDANKALLAVKEETERGSAVIVP